MPCQFWYHLAMGCGAGDCGGVSQDSRRDTSFYARYESAMEIPFLRGIGHSEQFNCRACCGVCMKDVRKIAL